MNKREQLEKFVNRYRDEYDGVYYTIYDFEEFIDEIINIFKEIEK